MTPTDAPRTAREWAAEARRRSASPLSRYVLQEVFEEALTAARISALEDAESVAKEFCPRGSAIAYQISERIRAMIEETSK